MSTPEPPAILGFCRALGAALDKVAAGPDPVFLSPGDKKQILIELSKQAERMEALRHRMLGVADDAVEAEAARSVAALAAHHTRRDYARLRPEADLAAALEQRWRHTQTAWLTGQINRDQAKVIVEALDKLPDWVTPDQLASAEEHLLELAEEWEPHGLRALAVHLWEVIAPDEADKLEAEALAKEEAGARAATRLSLKRCGDGSTRITGRIPDQAATRLRTLLDAYTSPRRDHLDHPTPASGGAELSGGAGEPVAKRDAATGERLRPDRLRGLALCSLLEHADPDKLPHHGSTATTLMITMELDKLRDGLGSGLLPDGTALSPGEVRRLACTAGIIPVVLGTDSEALDVGRLSRFFNPAQQRAMRLRDKRCRAEGCDMPAAWCEAHHLRQWALGGKTDLKDGVLLCPWHHHRAHDDTYSMRKMPNGDYRFHKRT
jgi:hypothetical protein